MIQLSYPFLDAIFDTELGVTRITWKELAVGKPRHDALLAVADKTFELGLTQWLIDARAVYVIAQADEDWSRDVLMPRLVKGGLKALASVNSRLTIAAFVQAVSKGLPFHVQMFPEEAEAIEWLKSLS